MARYPVCSGVLTAPRSMMGGASASMGLDAVDKVLTTDADVVALEVEGDAELVPVKAQQFVVSAAVQARNVRDAVADGEHVAHRQHLGAGAEPAHAAHALFQLFHVDAGELALSLLLGLAVAVQDDLPRLVALVLDGRDGVEPLQPLEVVRIGGKVDVSAIVLDGEPLFDGAVVDAAVDLHADAADEGLVRLGDELHLILKALGELFLDVVNLLRRELHGGVQKAF